jgi:methyl-accepting chemotaxis protein
MFNRLTLRQCFLLGLIALLFSVFSTLMAVRYLGKTALLYKMERAHKVGMLEVKTILEAVSRGEGSQYSRAHLLTLLNRVNAISLLGLEEFFPLERVAFFAVGFNKPFELTARDVVLNQSMRQAIEQESSANLTPATAERIAPFLHEQLGNSELFQPEFDRTLTLTKWAGIFLILLGFISLLLCGLLIFRRVILPLKSATKLAHKISNGDLTTDVQVRSNDEIGVFQTALKSMNESLANIAKQVRASSEGIATSANDIVAGSNRLAERTEHQASTLEQTAASMEELSVTTSNNLDQMRQAKTFAESAVSAAHASGAAVTHAIEIMSRMSESSKRIADIVGLIDGIAFQTNILALNAAVEAARAGEQGRGFAVVAQEVRQLAQKSATAAKEIKTLIDGSLTVVDESNRLIVDAGDKMRTTVDRIGHVAELVNQTELASSEQVSGIQQVNQAITQLEKVTQQNATLVDDATAAADSQQRQAQQLVELVRQFKLKDSPEIRAEPPRELTPITKKPVDRASPAIIAPRAPIGAVAGKTKWATDNEADWQEF